MRQLYVSVRLAALLVAVGACAGCVAIGGDAQEPPSRQPSRSAAEQDDKGAGIGPDGGSVVSGGSRRATERESTRPGSDDDTGESASATPSSATPTGTSSPSASAEPTPTRTTPTDGPAATPTPPPTRSTPGTTPTPDLPGAEPPSTVEGDGGAVDEREFQGREPSPQTGPS